MARGTGGSPYTCLCGVFNKIYQIVCAHGHRAVCRNVCTNCAFCARGAADEEAKANVVLLDPFSLRAMLSASILFLREIAANFQEMSSHFIATGSRKLLEKGGSCRQISCQPAESCVPKIETFEASPEVGLGDFRRISCVGGFVDTLMKLRWDSMTMLLGARCCGCIHIVYSIRLYSLDKLQSRYIHM